MRVLITVGIFPPDIGGPATFVPPLAAALTERGHDVTVLAVTGGTGKANTNYPFRLVRLRRGTPRLWRWLQTVINVVWWGRGADVLFVNGLGIEAAVGNLVLRRPMLQKVVGDIAWERARVRGWTGDEFEPFQRTHYGPKIEALKSLRAWAARTADKVVVPSRYLERWVVGWGVRPERVVVVRNAVEPARNVLAAKVPLDGQAKVVTVGRLVPFKGLDGLMRVIRDLPSVGLVVIGDGPERGRLEELAAALGMRGRVYFAGVKDREETRALIAACDVFVLNSSYEGLPHVVLEAMALGMPVIATAVGGTPEIVEDGRNGRLVAPGDESALREAVSGLISHKGERERLGVAARGSIAADDWSRMVDEIERVLSTVVGRRV